MQRFATLLERLVYTSARNGKLALIADYLKAAPDPDRGWGLAALTGTLSLPAVSASVIRTLMKDRVDPVLFDLSYDYVGDLAETCALLWPEPVAVEPPPLHDMVERMRALTRQAAPRLLASLLDRLDLSGRIALLKLATGSLRVGVNAALARAAFAQAFGADAGMLEELWHGQSPPFAALFAWGEGRAAPPAVGTGLVFRPFMLAHPLEDAAALDLADWQAEWKWDGIRVQVVSDGTSARLYSRSGDDISPAFPEVTAALRYAGAFDGELLVRGADGGPAPFNDLQQRLNRKTPTQAQRARHPAFVRLYDLLFDGATDLRGQPLAARHGRLREIVAQLPAERFDLSAPIEAENWSELVAWRAAARSEAIEGLMLKRRDSPYVAGRRVGLWYKWKRDPLTADCVLMYAQRGHGKRSSYYSDFTFGVWGAEGALLPVGKAYFGFTDAELLWLDKWVRAHTTNRFGPVREVERALVLEVAFDSIHASTRHKSGLAMRFPRIARIRADKPAAEADRLETLFNLAS